MLTWFRSRLTLKRLAWYLVVAAIVSLVVWVMTAIPTCSDKALERSVDEAIAQGIDPADLDNHDKMYNLYVVNLDEMCEAEYDR